MMDDESLCFLSVAEVVELHDTTLAVEGGSGGVRDMGLLESAVAMPQIQAFGHYLHTDIETMAAAYLFHITQNHPFIDGNKRAAALAMLAFLFSNDQPMPDPFETQEITLRVASGYMGKSGIARWLKSSGPY